MTGMNDNKENASTKEATNSDSDQTAKHAAKLHALTAAMSEVLQNHRDEVVKLSREKLKAAGFTVTEND